ncbi:DUF2911 domain-containing protein [Gillisia sp. CAL575]|uniref:DUF2911 domain-containing protein n=1 Tax=Gillisia sp. CAL575 TaxID=985255 RepID=UPI0003A78A2A|nr:DUF2911 domain-containing protein [Gillisia sp. CAL575]
MKKVFLFMCAGLLALGTSAQIEAPQPSPAAKIEQKVGLTDVTLEYSRPAVRDREIFGELVPFGEVWRTGANANTKITFSDSVEIGGKNLAKGTYAIYTIPNKDSWEVLFYKDASNWGNPQEWDDSKVALKATAKVETMPFSMESFGIFVNEISNGGAVLDFVWSNTSATLPFKVPTDVKTLASIEKVMNGPGANDYYAAASFYQESGKDLKKAHEWVKKATAMQDDAFWMWRKRSLIEAELGMKKEAISSAQKSMALAEKAKNADYVKMNKASLKEWGAI